MKVAVIDLGTNTFHLIVADKRARFLAELHKERRFVRLGQGGISHSTISPEAYKRGLQVMSDFSQIIFQYKVDQTIAIATSAIRNASNGRQFVDDVKAQTGIEIQVIDGNEEAELIYEGVKSSLPLGEKRALVMDIGGGSVEFIIGQGAEILWKQSFEIGVQRLYDQFHQQDPLGAQAAQALNDYLLHTLQPLSEAIQACKPEQFIGASGAFDTMWDMIHLKRRPKDEMRLSHEPLTGLYAQLVANNREQRLAMPGMLPMRVDLLVVGAGLVKAVWSMIGNIDTLRIAEGSLKEGALHKALREALPNHFV